MQGSLQLKSIYIALLSTTLHKCLRADYDCGTFFVRPVPILSTRPTHPFHPKISLEFGRSQSINNSGDSGSHWKPSSAWKIPGNTWVGAQAVGIDRAGPRGHVPSRVDRFDRPRSHLEQTIPEENERTQEGIYMDL